MVSNKALVLAKHPDGEPIPGKDLVITTTELDPTAAPPGGVILQTLSISYDP